MKKLLISLAVVAVLVGVMAAPVLADIDQDVTASVTVSEYSSVTITGGPISFGTLSPDSAIKVPAVGNPVINVAAASENNQDISVGISGTNFAGDPSGTILIANAFWDTTDTPGAATAMSTTEATVESNLSAGESIDIYHWLTVPDETLAASYESTFTYHTDATAEP